jgi:hypothetical protein
MIITDKQFTSFIHLVKQGITDKWNSKVTKAPTSCQWTNGSLQASDDAWVSINTHQHKYKCHTDTRWSTSKAQATSKWWSFDHQGLLKHARAG